MTTPILTSTIARTVSGRIVKTTRVTTTPYTAYATDHHIYVDTDGGAITVNLPVGVVGTEYVIRNVGSAGNNVTIVPNGTEKLMGTAASDVLIDGEQLQIVYETTEGWY